MFGLPVLGYHDYQNAKANMDIRLLGLYAVVKAKGDEMNKAETVTVFNDMCLMFPATLIDKERHSSNQHIPIFMAHGLYDNVVPLGLAEDSYRLLQTQGYPISWHTYPIPHSVCPEEINDVSDWFSRVLC